MVQLSQRLDALGARVDQLTKNQEVLQQTMVQLSQRLDALGARVDQLTKNQEVLQQTVADLVKSIAELRKDYQYLNKALGSMGSRWGVLYEKVIADFLKEVAQREGLDYRYINRFTFKDEEGNYGPKGTQYEIDILAKNGKTYLIEVKSFAKSNDVDWFNLKCDVITKVLNLKNVVRMFLAISVMDEAVKRAEELGIKLVYEDVVKIKGKDED
ncbi:hypothetical protein L3N51_01448 [Metallosphaera sp. J1]|nr:hypothetical protein [Metallosphaera javensis (ex Hofmann et al. 2022)]